MNRSLFTMQEPIANCTDKTDNKLGQRERTRSTDDIIIAAGRQAEDTGDAKRAEELYVKERLYKIYAGLGGYEALRDAIIRGDSIREAQAVVYLSDQLGMKRFTKKN